MRMNSSTCEIHHKAEVIYFNEEWMCALCFKQLQTIISILEAVSSFHTYEEE